MVLLYGFSLLDSILKSHYFPSNLSFTLEILPGYIHSVVKVTAPPGEGIIIIKPRQIDGSGQFDRYRVEFSSLPTGQNVFFDIGVGMIWLNQLSYEGFRYVKPTESVLSFVVTGSGYLVIKVRNNTNSTINFYILSVSAGKTDSVEITGQLGYDQWIAIPIPKAMKNCFIDIWRTNYQNFQLTVRNDLGEIVYSGIDSSYYALAFKIEAIAYPYSSATLKYLRFEAPQDVKISITIQTGEYLKEKKHESKQFTGQASQTTTHNILQREYLTYYHIKKMKIITDSNVVEAYIKEGETILSEKVGADSVLTLENIEDVKKLDLVMSSGSEGGRVRVEVFYEKEKKEYIP